MRQRIEYPNNTPDQCREYLADALELVEALDPPEDLRAIVFDKAANLLSSKQIMFEEVALGQPIGVTHPNALR